MGVIAWIVLSATPEVIAEHLTGRRSGLLLATDVAVVTTFGAPLLDSMSVYAAEEPT